MRPTPGDDCRSVLRGDLPRLSPFEGPFDKRTQSDPAGSCSKPVPLADRDCSLMLRQIGKFVERSPADIAETPEAKGRCVKGGEENMKPRRVRPLEGVPQLPRCRQWLQVRRSRLRLLRCLEGRALPPAARSIAASHRCGDGDRSTRGTSTRPSQSRILVSEPTVYATSPTAAIRRPAIAISAGSTIPVWTSSSVPARQQQIGVSLAHRHRGSRQSFVSCIHSNSFHQLIEA